MWEPQGLKDFFRALHIKSAEGPEPLNMPFSGGHRALLICKSVHMAHRLCTQCLCLPSLWTVKGEILRKTHKINT